MEDEKKNKKRLSSSFDFGGYRERTAPSPDDHRNKRVMSAMSTEPESTSIDMDDQQLQNQESFFDLMETFANLNLPDDDAAPEQCPLCPDTFPLDEFAAHVLVCIKKLDDVEKEHQEQMDRKMAENMTDWSTMDQLSEFQAPSTCEQGSSCTRTDAGHFQAVHHPKVPCPICGSEFEVYQINAHINLCLTKGPEERNNPFARAAAQPCRLAPAPVDDDSDVEDAEEAKRQSLVARLTRAPSDDLSLRQMQAMSKLVLQEKAKQAPDGLFSMLDRFKTLGFTAKNLEKQLQGGQGEDEKNGEKKQN